MADFDPKPRQDRFPALAWKLMRHDLRTPVNGIMGVVALLRDAPLRADEQRLLDLLEQSGQAMLASIDALAQLAAIEAGRVLLTPEAVPLRAVLEELRERWPQLRWQLSPAVPAHVRADEQRLRQLLRHLLNCAGAPGQGADASFGADYRDAQLRLRLAAPALDRDGVDYALCLALTALMGGGVDTGVGSGAAPALRIRLPLAADAVAPRPGPGADAPLLWVVDDNPVNRALLHAMVNHAGARAETLADGRAALDRLQDPQVAPPDLILMDVRMPGLDGCATTRLIRALPGPLGALPIIAVSAASEPADRQRAAAAGMNDFLAKPIDPAAIARLVSRIRLGTRVGTSRAG
ncbi:MAG: hypothetical protein Tsb0016_17880 [Sphingomonadales bacterium]